MAKDYYQLLGLNRNASKEDIKKAWKRLAKQYHPDINKDSNASEKFKEINEAASVLADEKKKAHYDQFGTAEPGPQGQGFSGDFSGFDFGNLDDIFESFFGGCGFARRRGGRSRGSDLRFDLAISLEEAAFGVTKKIVIPKLVSCKVCKGLGAASKDDMASCSVCGGSGVEKRVQRTPFGLFQSTTTCHKCHGQGNYITKACHECDGTGVNHEKKTLEVKIPAGVEDGSRLRMNGEGEAAERGGEPGDLYIMISVAEHKLFQRDGDDLYLDIPISFAQACIGDEVEIPTLKGKAVLKIPAGTQTGTIFRMKGKGITSLHGYGVGNQNVRVTVDVPTKISGKQKELLKEFDKEGGKKSLLGKLFS